NLFTPAIYYAENGFAVQELIGSDWKASEPELKKDSESKRVFLPHDEAPAMGQLFKNPEVAKALRLIADGGAQAFYSGEIAKAILATEREFGGVMSEEDLKEFSPEWVE